MKKFLLMGAIMVLSVGSFASSHGNECEINIKANIVEKLVLVGDNTTVDFGDVAVLSTAEKPIKDAELRLSGAKGARLEFSSDCRDWDDYESFSNNTIQLKADNYNVALYKPKIFVDGTELKNDFRTFGQTVELKITGKLSTGDFIGGPESMAAKGSFYVRALYN